MAANSTTNSVLEEIKEEGAKNATNLVFHCVGCRTILGDSLSWVGADENLRTVSLSGKNYVRNVFVKFENFETFDDYCG